MSALLEVKDLTVQLKMDAGMREVITGTSLTIGAGEAMGLVGESGSGKSMTAKAIARLLPKGAETQGSVTFDGVDVLALEGDALRKHRSKVAVVFQDPRAHINPVRRIDDFMTESLRLLQDVPKSEARKRAAAALEEVGIDDPAKRLGQFPHELSGGMLQRVMIATALLSEPPMAVARRPAIAGPTTSPSSMFASSA